MNKKKGVSCLLTYIQYLFFMRLLGVFIFKWFGYCFVIFQLEFMMFLTCFGLFGLWGVVFKYLLNWNRTTHMNKKKGVSCLLTYIQYLFFIELLFLFLFFLFFLIYLSGLATVLLYSSVCCCCTLYFFNICFHVLCSLC